MLVSPGCRGPASFHAAGDLADFALSFRHRFESQSLAVRGCCSPWYSRDRLFGQHRVRIRLVVDSLRTRCKHETVLTGGCKHVNSSLRGGSILVPCATCPMYRRRFANTFGSSRKKGTIRRKAARRGPGSSLLSSEVRSRNKRRQLV